MTIKGKRVLIFGDSLSARSGDSTGIAVTESSNRSGSPGDLLASMLLEAGASAARLDAKVGRSAANFFRLEPADTLLAADRQWLGANGVVLVMLGTNDASTGTSTVTNRVAFTRLRDAFPGQEIWVIGPPSFSAARNDITAKTPAVIATEQAVFGTERFIDSRPLTTDLTQPGVTRTSDNVHFLAPGAKAWATRLAQTLLVRMEPARFLPAPVTATTVATQPSPQPTSNLQPLLIGFGVGAVVAVGLWLVLMSRKPH